MIYEDFLHWIKIRKNEILDKYKTPLDDPDNAYYNDLLRASIPTDTEEEFVYWFDRKEKPYPLSVEIYKMQKRIVSMDASLDALSDMICVVDD